MPLDRRSFWLKIHLYVGVVAGLPLAIVGLTGTLLAVQPEVQPLLQPDLYGVSEQGSRMPVTAVVREIRAAYPEARIFHTSAFQDPDRAWIVYSSEGRLIVDPYSGQVQKDTAGWFKQIEQIHRTLGASTVGRYVVGSTSLILVLVIASGIYLWFPMWRGTLRRFWHRARALDWHNVTGLAASPFLIVMGLTGITLTFGSVVMPLVFMLTASPEMPEPPQSEPAGASSVTLVEAVQTVETAYPDAIITAFGEPAPDDTTGVFKVHLGYPGELNEFGWLRVFVDRHSGDILEVRDTYAHSWGSVYKQTWWQLHTGELFGISGRLVWGVAALLLPVLFGTGLVRWWKKRTPSSKPRMSSPLRARQAVRVEKDLDRVLQREGRPTSPDA